ncbi:hypothetical protein ZHAS_00013641 [Anopheles sinensis]|uniref:Peptidase S1 domain-containing protein n=1 Tax=Anopheles sinensis TaxID=74873 RepID=A0A084W603_ANOSI|nr:hypothetical protein ZHAS_00013641 [Anopheles sinensis]
MVDGLQCLELDRHAYGPVLTSKMFCAGGRPGVSACKGDSGGGMFFSKNDTWYISGIVAFIPKRYDASCDSTKYTVFTKVSKYHQWILGAMNTRRYSKDLEPCKHNFVASKTLCNAANKFDHSFLLVGHLNGIRRVPMNGDSDVNIITGDNIASLDHDCSKGRVYWLTNRRSEIWSAKYDGTDKKLFISEGRNSFVIAVDWISRRLYWSDYEKNAIHVASLDNPDLRSILISDLNRPISIAVDPYRGKLYWVERSRTESSSIEIQIVSSNLDGTERQILISGPQIAYSSDIRVSMTTGELCYIDSLKIDCIDTKNKKIQTIGSNLRNPFGLAVTDDSMYWTSGLLPSDKIERIDLHGVQQEPIPIPYSIVYSMTAVTSTCPLFSNACSTDNGGCPENTICLINPRIQSGRNCIKIKN